MHLSPTVSTRADYCYSASEVRFRAAKSPGVIFIIPADTVSHNFLMYLSSQPLGRGSLTVLPWQVGVLRVSDLLGVESACAPRYRKVTWCVDGAWRPLWCHGGCSCC